MSVPEPEYNCNTEALQEILGKNKLVLVVAVTPECEHGAQMRKFLRENLDTFKEKEITVVELDADTKKCLGLARELQIDACPTAVFFRSRKEIKRFIPEGQSPEEVLKILTDFKTKPKPRKKKE